MENRAYALTVGIFVLLLGAALAGAFWWFSGNFEDTRQFMVVSHRGVTGLNPQAAVRFRGVRVGKVTGVTLSRAGEVQIKIRISADTPVSKSTKARVGMAGITGQGFIALDDDGSSQQALLPAGPDDIPRIPLQPGLFDDLAGAGKDVLSHLQETSARVERILSDENLARIDKTLASLAASSESLQKALVQTSGLVADVRRFSSPKNAERLSATLEQIRAMSTRFGPALEEFRNAAGKVNVAAGRIDQVGAAVQAGLSGDTLPRINQLAAELQASTLQLSRVLEDVQRTPQVLLTGKEQLTPGPGETVP